MSTRYDEKKIPDQSVSPTERINGLIQALKNRFGDIPGLYSSLNYKTKNPSKFEQFALEFLLAENFDISILDKKDLTLGGVVKSIPHQLANQIDDVISYNTSLKMRKSEYEHIAQLKNVTTQTRAYWVYAICASYFVKNKVNLLSNFFDQKNPDFKDEFEESFKNFAIGLETKPNQIARTPPTVNEILTDPISPLLIKLFDSISKTNPNSDLLNFLYINFIKPFSHRITSQPQINLSAMIRILKISNLGIDGDKVRSKFFIKLNTLIEDGKLEQKLNLPSLGPVITKIQTSLNLPYSLTKGQIFILLIADDIYRSVKRRNESHSIFVKSEILTYLELFGLLYPKSND